MYEGWQLEPAPLLLKLAVMIRYELSCSKCPLSSVQWAMDRQLLVLMSTRALRIVHDQEQMMGRLLGCRNDA